MSGPHREYGGIHSAIGLGICGGQPLGQSAQFRARLVDCDPRLEPHDGGGEIAAAAVIERGISRNHLASHRNRYPEVINETNGRAAELWRRDSNDSQLVTVQTNRLAQDLAIPLKAVLPHPVADYSNRKGSRLVGSFPWQECAPEYGFNF